MDIRAYNRTAWDREVEKSSKYTISVNKKIIANARRGNWRINLTPTKPVPSDWIPDIKGLDVLCLASGGGQQGPILAAAGANVTVFDNSPKQLEQDRFVAERDSLDIITVEGDMADLSAFTDSGFDLVIHPVSNTFVPRIRPVWKEAYRVLKKGGALLSGFTNPAVYLFDWELADRARILQVKYKLPYSDLESLSENERQSILVKKLPVEYSHTLEDQIGGQIEAGFIITGFYEDSYDKRDDELLTEYMPQFIVSRAQKP